MEIISNGLDITNIQYVIIVLSFSFSITMYILIIEISKPKMYIRLSSGKKYDISQDKIIKLSGKDLRKTLEQININLEFCKKVESFQYIASYYDLERNDINSGKLLVGNNKIFCDEDMSYLPDALFRSLTLENI